MCKATHSRTYLIFQDAADGDETSNDATQEDRRRSLTDRHISKNDEIAAVTNLIEDSECRNLFNELLSRYYIPMEIWYLRSIIGQVSVSRLSGGDLLTALLGAQDIHYRSLAKSPDNQRP